MAKEVSVRLHEELERLETKKVKAHDELERIKRLLDESEERRLSLQKEVNSVTNEVLLLLLLLLLLCPAPNRLGH